MKRVIEKPKKPKTNLKGVGVYLFSRSIFDAIQQASKIQSRNKELGITEAIQILIDNGRTVLSSSCVKEDLNINEPIDLWNINMNLLKKFKRRKFISQNVSVGKKVSIINSVVGPNVSIGNNVLIKDSVIFSGVKINNKTSIIRSIRTEENFIKLK